MLQPQLTRIHVHSTAILVLFEKTSLEYYTLAMSFLVNRQVVRHLLGQTMPNTIATLPDRDAGWHPIPALFTRAGATADARALLR